MNCHKIVRRDGCWLFLFTALITLGVDGCEPYLFDMGGSHPVAGKILTSLESVVPGSRVTTVRDRGAIQLENFGVPEYTLRLGLKLDRGDGAEILIHPRVEVSTVVDSGIVARLTTHGEWLRDGALRLAARPDLSIPLGDTIPVTILSEAHFLQVIVGCDTLYRGRSDRIESDDIVVRSLDGSEVQVISPSWRYVPDLVR
jgi:hypothetical protein